MRIVKIIIITVRFVTNFCLVYSLRIMFVLKVIYFLQKYFSSFSSVKKNKKSFSSIVLIILVYYYTGVVNLQAKSKKRFTGPLRIHIPYN